MDEPDATMTDITDTDPTESYEQNRVRIAELIERQRKNAGKDQVTDLDQDQIVPEEDDFVTFTPPGGPELRIPRTLAERWGNDQADWPITFIQLDEPLRKAPTFIEVHWVVGGAATFECTRGWVISDMHGHDTMIIKQGTEETPGYPRAEIPMSSILWYRVGPGTV